MDDETAEILAKTFWETYEPAVRALGHIEGGPMAWEALPQETRSALVMSFKALVASDILRPGSNMYRQG